MSRTKAPFLAEILALALAGCAGPISRPLIDPSAVRFPLVEAGTLEIEGTVVGQPRARDAIVYFATREGFLTAVVVPARQASWRFKAEHTISASPELSENHILLRDDTDVLYVIDFRGTLVFKKRLDEDVTSPVREYRGRVYFGTVNGKVMALDPSANGAPAWEYRAAAAITAGPVFAGDMAIFGTADGQLIALDQAGKIVWKFIAKGRIAVDPAAGNARLYFGTEDRNFYCLRAGTGKRIWSRRLQGAPLHPALVSGRRIALAVSNSVVYFLSGRGGSILSWEAVPSRIVHDIAIAGPLILVSSATPNLMAIDFATGKRAGEHLASGPLAAGALWVSPFVVLITEGEESGRQRLVFLRSKPASPAGDRSPGD